MATGDSPTFRLTYQLAGRPVTVQFDRPEVVFGRGADCDLVLPVPGISRRHAAIRRTETDWRVADLGSLNGTFVNGRRTAGQVLREGDQISPGPEGQFAVTLTFLPGVGPPSQEDLVVVDDREAAQDVGLTINVDEYAAQAGGAVKTLAPAGAGPRPGPGGAAVVGLFRQLGELLLLSGGLDEMLARVVDLALAHLPAQRGFIGLCGREGEDLRLKAVRTKGKREPGPVAVSRSIVRAAVQARQAVLVSDAPGDARFDQAESIRRLAIRTAMCAPLYHAGQVQGLIYVDSDRPEDRFTGADLELLAALGGMTAVGIQQARLREDVARERAVRSRLSQYHSPAVVEQIVAKAGLRGGELAPEQYQVSVLFGDLCGFTPMAAAMSPREVAEVLNGVFEQLTHAVFLYGGTLDKYLGDAVMAIFGAPLVQANHAERAIRAGLRMLQLLDQFNRTRPRAEPLRMRVGVNSGTAVCGDIGSPVQKGYTVIGDVVNVASRLESSVARPGQVVIGPATHELVQGAFECRPLAEVQLRGKDRPIRPYLVLGVSGEATVDVRETA